LIDAIISSYITTEHENSASGSSTLAVFMILKLFFSNRAAQDTDFHEMCVRVGLCANMFVLMWESSELEDQPHRCDVSHTPTPTPSIFACFVPVG
jgi:hypothetical protein